MDFQNLKSLDWLKNLGWLRNIGAKRGGIIGAAVLGVLVLLGIGFSLGQQKKTEVVVVTPEKHEPMDASEKDLPPETRRRTSRRTSSR